MLHLQSAFVPARFVRLAGLLQWWNEPYVSELSPEAPVFPTSATEQKELLQPQGADKRILCAQGQLLRFCQLNSLLVTL